MTNKIIMRTLTFLLALIVLSGCSSSTIPVVTPTPASISGIAPTSGPAGTPITISGSNFPSTAELALLVAGTPARIDSSNSTTIWSTIPLAAAAGIARIAVIASHDTSTATQLFTVTADPIVTGIYPSSGYHGQLVEIRGSNLSRNGAPLLLQVNFFGSDSTIPVQSSAPSDPFYVRVPLDAKSGAVTVSSSGSVITGTNWPRFTVLRTEPLTFNSFSLSLDHIQGSLLNYNNKSADSSTHTDTLSLAFRFTRNTGNAVDRDTSLVGYMATTYYGSSRSDTYNAHIEAIVDTVNHVISMMHAAYGHDVFDATNDNSSEHYQLNAVNLPYTVVSRGLQVVVSGSTLNSLVTSVGYAVQTSSHHGGGAVGTTLVSALTFQATSQLTITLLK